MTFSRKTLIWIFVIAVIIIGVAIIIYLFRCDIFKNLASCVEDPNKTTPPTPVPLGSPTSKWVPETFPLNIGMFGPKIKALQKALGFQDTNKNYPNYQDGRFGSYETRPAVIAKGYTVPLSESDYNKIVGISNGNSSGTPPVDPGNVVGKKVYAKQITNIRSTPDVNDGFINNKVCELPANYEPAPVIVEMKDCSKAGTGCVQINNYFWYKIQFQIANCSAKSGWVRQDVVTVQ